MCKSVIELLAGVQCSMVFAPKLELFLYSIWILFYRDTQKAVNTLI